MPTLVLGKLVLSTLPLPILKLLVPSRDGTLALALAPSVVALYLIRLYFGTTMLTFVQPALTILESIDRPAQP